ncbi:MAG TPA: hypothetical protein GXX36_12960 [Clostridiaceae bacterium]|nr:hypothetical protein [Clostridiaceae bacterium]
MIKFRRLCLSVVFSMIVAFSLIAVFPNRIFGQVQPIIEIQEKLEEISDEEKKVLAHLFILLQEIEEMDRQVAGITQEIEILQTEIENLETAIENKQKDYDNQLKVLEQVLVSYQRRGPASYLQTILSAKDLTAFVRSFNTVRDLSRNVGELLDAIEEGKKELTAQKEVLAENVALLEKRKGELKEALARKQQIKDEQEVYLASLREGREYYEQQLAIIEQMWNDSKAMFSQIIDEFTRIMNEGNIPLEAFNIRIAFPSVKGTIYEETINDIVEEHSRLPKMVFHFRPGKVEVEVPEKHLKLTGTFSIEGKSVIKFIVEEGSFYEMPLEPVSIEELFKNGYLSIDFSNYVDNITLESIEISEGYMEFKIRPFF